MRDIRIMRKATWCLAGAVGGFSVILAAMRFAAPAGGQVTSTVPTAQARAEGVPVEGLAQGDALDLAGRRGVVRLLDTLPVVQNEVSRRYVYDRHDNPKLAELRRQNRLDDVIAVGRDELEKQLLLMEWVHAQIEYGDPVDVETQRDARKILELSRKEQKLFCGHYASLLTSSAASLGWVCRIIGVSGHSFTEMWSNQYRRWVVFDPTGNWCAEKDGAPINTYEMRKDWFENRGRNLSFFRGRSRQPVGGRGSFDKYHILYYFPHTDVMDSRRDANGPFVTQDRWTQPSSRGSDILKDPAAAPYFPINQASLALTAEGRDLRVGIRTLTPNFKTFRVRIDGGPWTDSNATSLWPLHEGANLLRAKSVNLFGMDGPVSTAEVEVLPAGAAAGSQDIVLPGAAFAAEGNGHVTIRPPEGEQEPSYVHLWSTPGHWLEWTVEAPREGLYDVTLTYSTRYHPAREMRVNGETAAGLESFALAPTGGWIAWSPRLLPAQVPLKAGKNILRLACLDEASLSLAEIRLSRPGERDLVVEAIRFSGQGNGKVQVVPSSEGGYFRNWGAKGGWFEWTFEAPQAGEYDLHMCYATMYASPREVRVNGEVVQGLERYAPPLTGGWTNWVEERLPAPVTLRQGKNLLRMTGVEGLGVNLCYLRLLRPGLPEIRIDAVRFSDRSADAEVTFYGPSRHASITDWYRKGQWVEWNLPAPSAGPYEMVLRYASEAASPREFRLNGAAVKGLESFSPPPAGGTRMWKEFRVPVPLQLKEGANVLRVTNLGTRGLNVDEIRLRRLDKP